MVLAAGTAGGLASALTVRPAVIGQRSGATLTYTRAKWMTQEGYRQLLREAAVIASGSSYESETFSSIESGIFPRGPIALIAPCLEIGIGPLREEDAPSRLKVGAGLAERRGCTPAALARSRARIKSAAPLPLRSGARVAGTLRDHARIKARRGVGRYCGCATRWRQVFDTGTVDRWNGQAASPNP